MTDNTATDSFSSPYTIAKFGGTSVANYAAMGKCADIILKTPSARIVVLSASAGITNLLIELATGVDIEQRTQLLNQVRDIQYAIINQLADTTIISEEINRLLENIEMLSEAAALATSDALTDELVSHGELMSTLLFVEILREKGVVADWFDVRKIMKTNGRFCHAEPDMVQLTTLTQNLIQPRLEESVIVTQGFIGQEPTGKTTTLGRGGSDYTAALIGEALNVARIDIWTDVAGIYSTDPRIVPQAHRIDRIAFDEAAEMATFGAKILHPATLLPAVRSGIPVFVGSSKAPEEGGTLVCAQTDNPPVFRAITLRRKQTLLTLHSLKMLHARGFLAEIFTILSRHHISVDVITTSEVSIALTLDTTGTTSASSSLLTNALLTELASVCRVEVEENLALVAIIGNDLSQTNGLGSQIFTALEHYNIRMISHGASPHNLCLLVEGNDADNIVRQLHDTLF